MLCLCFVLCMHYIIILTGYEIKITSYLVIFDGLVADSVKMNCIICEQSSKYKCPSCRQPYCSVGCCIKHKETPCSPPLLEPAEPAVQVQCEFPTEDTVPMEKLKLLGESKELLQCLGNPHVRDILKLLDSSPHPDSLFQEFMQNPIFVNIVDECLKVVQPPEEDGKR